MLMHGKTPGRNCLNYQQMRSVSQIGGSSGGQYSLQSLAACFFRLSYGVLGYLGSCPMNEWPLSILEPAPVAEKPAVDPIVAPGHGLQQFAVAGGGDGVAAERAVGADRGGEIVVPVAGLEAVGLVGEDAGRADVDQVAGKRGFEWPSRIRPKIDPAARCP